MTMHSRERIWEILEDGRDADFKKRFRLVEMGELQCANSTTTLAAPFRPNPSTYRDGIPDRSQGYQLGAYVVRARVGRAARPRLDGEPSFRW